MVKSEDGLVDVEEVINNGVSTILNDYVLDAI